jgi:hypothetical protein
VRFSVLFALASWLENVGAEGFGSSIVSRGEECAMAIDKQCPNSRADQGRGRQKKWNHDAFDEPEARQPDDLESAERVL